MLIAKQLHAHAFPVENRRLRPVTTAPPSETTRALLALAMEIHEPVQEVKRGSFLWVGGCVYSRQRSRRTERINILRPGGIVLRGNIRVGQGLVSVAKSTHQRRQLIFR